MKKKKVLIFIIVAVLLSIIICAIFTKMDSKQEEQMLPSININLQDFTLKNREKLFVDEELLIGENSKELENGYYDFKLFNNGNMITITLNKLWYKEYGDDYIEDEYLAKICREIVRCIELSSDKEELDYYLYKYIKENYLNIKQGMVGPKLELEGISISSKSVANECIVYLKVE